MKHILFVVLSLFAITVHAQDKTPIYKAISAGVELGIPSRTVYDIGVATSLKGEIPIIAPVSLTITGGYSVFSHKNNVITGSNTFDAATFVPLKAGLRWYLGETVCIEGEAGTSIETNYEKKKLFAFSLGPSFLIPVGQKQNVDLGFRYENWANQVRQTAIRIAYRFGGK
jgi:hypothetical protein